MPSITCTKTSRDTEWQSTTINGIADKRCGNAVDDLTDEHEAAGGARWFRMNANRAADDAAFEDDVSGFAPRSELDLDPRLLFALVTGVLHWNNAEIGSLYRTRRVPDEYRKPVQAFLDFFHV